MKDPKDAEGNTTVEMYVTEELPNQPNHYPLTGSKLSAEPLELIMNMLGMQITFGVVTHEKGINLFNQLNMDPEKAKKIDFQIYEELKL